MLDRLKQALVESFVGAIGLGWLFAQGMLHFANIFAAPVAAWIMRRQYRGLMDRAAVPTGLSLQDAVPELAKSVSLLVVGYLLLRWLYFKPPEEGTTDSGPEQSPNTDLAV